MKAGEKLEHASGVAVIIVKPPADGDVAIRDGGEITLGKRYTCESCNAEALVTKGGAGELVCHDAVMTIAQPKTLPSSD